MAQAGPGEAPGMIPQGTWYAGSEWCRGREWRPAVELALLAALGLAKAVRVSRSLCDRGAGGIGSGASHIVGLAVAPGDFASLHSSESSFRCRPAPHKGDGNVTARRFRSAYSLRPLGSGYASGAAAFSLTRIAAATLGAASEKVVTFPSVLPALQKGRCSASEVCHAGTRAVAPPVADWPELNQFRNLQTTQVGLRLAPLPDMPFPASGSEGEKVSGRPARS